MVKFFIGVICFLGCVFASEIPLDEFYHTCSDDDYNTCIDSISQEKIYFKPEKIEVSEFGIFISLNEDDKISVPTLYSDEFGCYASHDLKLCNWRNTILNRCPDCDEEYFCSCRNKDCPSQERVKERKEEMKRLGREYKEKKLQEKEEERNRKQEKVR